MPSDVTLLSPEQVAEVKAEWNEWRYNDQQMIPEVLIEAMDELLLAAELLDEMARQADFAREGLFTMGANPFSLEPLDAILARYRAALRGTSEDGSGSAREASAVPQDQGANPKPATPQDPGPPMHSVCEGDR